MPTQLEYNLAKKRQRIESVKINLLNFNMQKVDEISGVVLEKPIFNISSSSDIRRSCNIKITPNDSSYLIQKGSKIWMDKYIQIFYGIKIPNSEEYEWTNMGIYLINNPNQVYNASQNIITIDGLDLMSKLTGLRNGNLEGIDYKVPKGTNVRQAIIGCLKEAGFSKYSVEEMYVSIDSQITQETPYDIVVGVGGTIYDILTQLVGILPSYQMYFDVDGTFCFNKIPNGQNEQVMVDDDIWNGSVISYSKSVDYTEVKNVIEVYGKTHDITNYGEATISGGNISATISSIVSLYNYTKIGLLLPSHGNMYVGIKININNLGYYDVVNPDGTNLLLSSTSEETYLVFQFDSSLNKFIYLGKVQPYAIVKETNKNSPFYSGAEIGGNIRDIDSSTINYIFDDLYSYSDVFMGNNYISICIPNDIVSNSTNIRFYKPDGSYWSGDYSTIYPLNTTNITIGRYLLKGNSNETFDLSTDNSIGRIRKVFQGGEYETITSDYLAQQRAEYELYLNCRLNDKVTIETVPIYWLDVNWLIELTLYDKQQNYSHTDLYITKEISIADTQVITLMKYYPLYPSIQ